MTDSISKQFYNLYKNFLNDIITSFPEFKEDIEKKHKLFLKPNYPKSEKLVKKCENWKKSVFKYLLDNGDLISKKDIQFFKCAETNTKLAKDIDFDYIISSNLSENSKEQIWNYIQTFYMMSISEHTNNDLSKLFNNFQSILEKGNEESLNEDTIKNIQQITGNIMENMKKEGDDTNVQDSNAIKNEFESIFEGSSIGKLAKDIASEINVDSIVQDNMDKPEDLFKNLMGGLGGSDNSDAPNIFNIVQNIGEKINDRVSSGELNEMQLLNEAQNIMGNLQNNQLFNGLTQGMNQNLSAMHAQGNSRQAQQKKRLQKKLKQKQLKDKE